jgi:hypothetical protein
MVERPKALKWLKTGHFLGIYTDRYEHWKRDAEDYFRHDFFESNRPIITPLEWTKTMLSDSYKTSSGNYQQTVVLLTTALLSSGLWGVS